MRKVFISYYHKDDQVYKYLLSYFNGRNNVFIDNSVEVGDIDDEQMTDEEIRIKIRDEYIKDSDVLILLCGKNSKHRKHIDWELHAAMYNSPVKKPIPILVINLPTAKNACRRCDDFDTRVIEKKGRVRWVHYNTYSEYQNAYPDLPKRVLDSIANKESQITIVDWEGLDMNDLKQVIENTYQRRNIIEYDDSDVLRRKNGVDE